MERKIEGRMMPSAPRVSYGVPSASSTAWGQTTTEGTHELTHIQRSARQAVTGKLPSFSGNPEEWAMFIASYEETTRLCGYTDGENILRLQLALKGKALKAVQCRLRHAKNLPEVMETLRAMYGRPELVINTLLEQVRRTPPPKADNLESLVDYGLAVEEICAIVRSSCTEHRFDGPLLQELMRNTKEAALLVTPPSTNRDDKRDGKWDEKRLTRYVNIHTPGRPNPQPQSTTTCACEERCRQLDCCEAFLKLPAAKRWKHVRENHFCSGCLKRHRNECRDKRTCGRNGCALNHHPLLHDNPATPEGSQPDVMLRYVPVTLYGRGKRVDTVALLDEGSTVTLMEHQLMKELELEGSTKPLCLSWTGGQAREENDSKVTNLFVSGKRPPTTICSGRWSMA
uniref:Peptidase A2 domain-containing protein n=1 Tax=Anopheles dirus TaxID=7168 RepID=A0A182NCB8_9DIPT